MYFYPRKDGVFPMFFDKMARLILSDDMLQIAEVEVWIKDHEEVRRVEREIFKNPAGVAEDHRPSPYQIEIFECEENMLLMLRVMLDTAKSRIHAAPSGKNAERLAILSQLPTIRNEKSYPYIHACQVYMALGAKIMLMHDGSPIESAEVAVKVFNNAIRIFKIINDYLDDYNNYVVAEIEDGYRANFAAMVGAFEAMLQDVEPTSNCGTYLEAMSVKLLGNLFPLSEFFAKNETKYKEKHAGKKVLSDTVRLNQQTFHYQVTHTNAMMRNLNLRNFPRLRAAYLSQGSQLSTRHLVDICSYTWGQDKRNPQKLVTQLHESSFIDIDHLETLRSSLTLLGTNTPISSSLLKSTVLQQLSHLRNKTLWLSLYRTNIAYETKALHDAQMSNSQLLQALTVGLARLTDPEQNEIEIDETDFECILDSLTTQFLGNLFFGQIKSDCVSCVITSLLNLRLKNQLKQAKSQEERNKIFVDVKTDIVYILEMMNASVGKLPANNYILAVHFALDYLCLSLMETDKADECVSLDAITKETSIKSLMAIIKNSHLYEFVYSYLVWIKMNCLDVSNVDVGFIGTFKDEQLQSLFTLASDAINTLDKPGNRVNATVMDFFLKHARLIMDYMSVLGEPDEIKAGLENLKKLDQYNKILHDRAKVSLEYFAPEKTVYVSTKSKEEINESFLKGTLAVKSTPRKAKPAAQEMPSQPKKAAVIEARSPVKKPKPVTVESTLKQLTREHGNTAAVVEFCKKHFGYRYSTREKGYALVKLAECAVALSDNLKKQKSVLLEIETVQEKTLASCKLELSVDVYADIQQRYQTAMAMFRKVEVKPQAPAVVAKPAPVVAKPAETTSNKNVSTYKQGMFKNTRNDRYDRNTRDTSRRRPQVEEVRPQAAVVKATPSATVVRIPSAPTKNPWKVAALVKPVVKPEVVAVMEAASTSVEVIAPVKVVAPVEVVTPVEVVVPLEPVVPVEELAPSVEVVAAAPAAARPVELPPFPMQTKENCYGVMLSDITLNIRLNDLQKRVIDLLIADDFEPYIHGGRPVYASKLQADIVMIPEPDLDLGCFTRDAKQLYDWLIQNKDKLGITNPERDIRADTANEVYIITFNNKLPNGDFEKLELAYIPVASKAEIPYKFKTKATGYGVNCTGYCRAKDMRMIFPSVRHQLFYSHGVIDVAWDDYEVPDPNVTRNMIINYFRRWPQRQLEVVDRMAKLGHYGCQVSFANRIVEAILVNHEALKKSVTHLGRTDKLVAQTYATASFSIMHQLRILQALFPVLGPHHIADFYQACANMDLKTSAWATRPSEAAMREIRSQFFAEALYKVSLEHPGLQAVLHGESYLFYMACSDFLKMNPIFISHQYFDFDVIQKSWQDKHRALLTKNEATHNDETIPDALKCTFTGELLVNPVFCTLDCRTYEDSKIREWLSLHQCSPFNRARLQVWETINDVLKPNRTVSDACDEYRARAEEKLKGKTRPSGP